VFALNDHFLHKKSLLGFTFQISVFFVEHFVIAVVAYLAELIGSLMFPFLPEVAHANDVLTELT
jgi:uncharacterized oligopeptide transporter (OPT) family protein